MTNMKEQVIAKIETLDAILRFLDNAKKDSINQVSIEDVQEYVKGMRKGYVDAFELLKRMPIN